MKIFQKLDYRSIFSLNKSVQVLKLGNRFLGNNKFYFSRRTNKENEKISFSMNQFPHRAQHETSIEEFSFEFNRMEKQNFASKEPANNLDNHQNQQNEKKTIKQNSEEFLKEIPKELEMNKSEEDSILKQILNELKTVKNTLQKVLDRYVHRDNRKFLEFYCDYNFKEFRENELLKDYLSGKIFLKKSCLEN